jgi:hypothetical protein
MPVTEQFLREHGYRQVRSDRHAYQLIRWWLKHLAKNQQRQRRESWLLNVLEVKPGAWFKIFRATRGTKGILIWPADEVTTNARQSKGD